MPSSFDAAWARASRAIDSRLGSSFEVQPMTAGRPDPARPRAIVTGALTETPVFLYPETVSRRSSIVAQEATQGMTIDIAVDAVPYDIRNGDWLEQVTLDVAGAVVARGALYEVNGPQPDGISRIELRVYKRRAGPPRAAAAPPA